MYKEALKQGITFSSTRLGGQVELNDLFFLPLESTNKICLDEMAVLVATELAGTKGKALSFVSKKSADTSILELKLDILKDIIKDKIAERDAAKDETINAAKREGLLKELHKRQSDYSGLTDEEIQAKLAAL